MNQSRLAIENPVYLYKTRLPYMYYLLKNIKCFITIYSKNMMIRASYFTPGGI